MTTSTQKPTQQTAEESAMPLRQQLKADLVVALRARQRGTVATLRATLSAIDQAEAVAVDPAFVPLSGMTKDVARKVLTEADIYEIVRREVAELADAIADYERLGNGEKGAELQAARELLLGYLGDGE